MNDFLHQLRTGSHKRFEKGRRNFDGNTYRGNERGNTRDRKTVPKKRPMDVEQLQAIRSILQSLTDTYKAAAEREALAAERQAVALESIAKHLKKLAPSIPFDAPMVGEPGPETPPRAGVASAVEEPDTGMVKVPTAEDGGTGSEGTETAEALGIDRGDLLAVIRERKEAGDSFTEIARHLNAKHIPTVTGKGTWRAQSVSRLYGQVG
jgi:hypothetical protein